MQSNYFFLPNMHAGKKGYCRWSLQLNSRYDGILRSPEPCQQLHWLEWQSGWICSHACAWPGFIIATKLYLLMRTYRDLQRKYSKLIGELLSNQQQHDCHEKYIQAITCKYILFSSVKFSSTYSRARCLYLTGTIFKLCVSLCHWWI